MRSDKNETGVIDGEYTLRRWLELFNEGKFNPTGNPYLDRKIAIDAGAYDWWNDTTAYKWITRLGKKIAQLAESKKINLDTTYVWYKQNCPCAGPLYDDFRFADINTGDVLFCVSILKKGCYGDDFSGYEIWDYSVKGEGSFATHEPTLRGNWHKVKEYFEVA